jgi:hypothetical protein
MSALMMMGMFFTNGLVYDSFAQEIIIETSADDHDGTFFGEGVLQVVITDPNAVDDNTVEDLQVEITADPDLGSATSESILVPETSDSSGRFEFFLVNVNSDAVDPADLDPINSVGVEGDGVCVTNCTPFVTFGPTGVIDVQADLYEEVRFEITVDNIQAEISYEETPVTLELDRQSYGTTSYVYISVVDQDANLNPTVRDEFTVDPGNAPNADMLDLSGGTFEDIVVFRETGDNTAVFEGRYRLGESILVESESLVLTLFGKANYEATLASPENDSNEIDEVSFTVGNSQGTVDIGGGMETEPTQDPILESDKQSYSLGENVHIVLTDPDANANSGIAETMLLLVSSGESSIEIAAIETGPDTGIFEGTFLLANETSEEVGEIRVAGTALIIYKDVRPADYFDRLQAGEDPARDFLLEIDVELPVRTGIEAVGIKAPTVRDVAEGGPPYSAGSTLTLSTEVTNNNEFDQPFALIIEVRDSDGTTLYLALHSGILEPSGTTDIGVSWLPSQGGAYQIRTFVLSGIGSGVEVLSPVAASEVVVR